MARVDFSMDGDPYHLSTEEVEEAVRGEEPEAIQQLAVGIDGRWWPVKQAFGRALGKRNTQFNSRKAFDVFRRLGLAVHDVKRDGPLPSAPGIAVNGAGADNLRLRSLELAITLGAPRGDSTDEAIANAERLLAWLKEE